jgi:hypothetical protein
MDKKVEGTRERTNCDRIRSRVIETECSGWSAAHTSSAIRTVRIEGLVLTKSARNTLSLPA